MTILLSETSPVARFDKRFCCDWCGEWIVRGTKYRMLRLVDSPDPPQTRRAPWDRPHRVAAYARASDVMDDERGTIDWGEAQRWESE